MTTRPKRTPNEYPVLTLKPGGAVCEITIPMRPLRIYFQHIPGLSGLERDRGIAGLAYKLRIHGQPEIEGQTLANGKIDLPGLRPGMVGELDILGTRLWLRPLDYSADEATDGRTAMTIHAAKRRLMVAGYYDRPYCHEQGNQLPPAQVLDDRLDHIEIEDAILRFQVDTSLEPNGEIERREIVGGKIDTSREYGFHADTASTTIGQFHPDFIAQLAAHGGSAPPDTMTPCLPPPREPVKPPDVIGQPKVLERYFYDCQRFVPVRFERYVPPGQPFDPRYPELDERGYLDRNGPVVSLVEGKTIELRLLRLHVGVSAKLVLRSTDESVVKVKISEPVQGIVALTGVAGSDSADPTDAVIEVRFGSASGPVLHRLHVEVYKMIDVAVAVHFVAIGDRNNPSVPPIPPSWGKEDIKLLLDEASKIWQMAGIRFVATAWRDETVHLDQAGAMKKVEAPTVGELNRVTRHMNMYVAKATTGTPDIGWGGENWALLVAEQSQRGIGHGIEVMAHTVAHEIGHFLGLLHPGTVNRKGDQHAVLVAGGSVESHMLEDYWSRRSLMYAAVGLMPAHIPLAATTRQRGRQMDIGYGLGRPGYMLCCKVVPRIVSSNQKSEIATARGIALLNESENIMKRNKR